VPEAFACLAVRHGCAGWKIGEQPLTDLARWPPPGRPAANLRTARNRAAREGVITGEWLPAVQPRRLVELRELRTAWLAARGGAQLGFVLGGDPFAPATGRRWFLAERAGRIEAVAVTADLPSRRAVALQHFLRRPDAPPGCMESAIAAALLVQREEGAETGLLALAPLRGLNRADRDELLIGREDRGHRIALRTLVWLREHGHGLYGAASLERFKQNLAPARWEPAYLIHFPARLLPRMAVAAAIELAPGGPRWLKKQVVRSIAPWRSTAMRVR
jgi:phosphatidylglycerol lysyltransferase